LGRETQTAAGRIDTETEVVPFGKLSHLGTDAVVP
jgi:hypothetical protein